MTKEEIAAIVLYCKQQNVSFKSRLEELGIPQWRFYGAKRKYVQNNSNELLEIGKEGAFIACPDLQRKNFKVKEDSSLMSDGSMSVELQTTSGLIMRIQGNLTPNQIQAIILSAKANV